MNLSSSTDVIQGHRPERSDLSWPTILDTLVARRDLSSEAAAWAMRQVVAGDATAAQLAAFLMALRAKGETAAEIDGLVTALLLAANPVVVPGPTVDIAGTGGDGTNAVNISSMAAIVVAATGMTVVKHGGRAASATTAGAADLVEQLGVALDLSTDDLAAIAVQVGITFVFAPQVHPGMRHAGPVRRELGVPTVFNVLGPLINPANPTYRLVGVAGKRFLPIVADVLRGRGATALVVRGDDGLDKLTTATTSQVWMVHDGQATHHVLDPRRLGIDRPPDGALRGGDARTNARIAHAVFAGQSGPVRDAVLLNAAGALVATTQTAPTEVPQEAIDEQLVDRFAQALNRCADAIDTGAAADTLNRWTRAAQRRAGNTSQ